MYRKYYKRIQDVILSLIALVVLMPLFVVVSLAIFLGDFHSPIYVQTRIGKNGKPFKFYKFRSMRVGADKEIPLECNEMTGPVFKMKNDPRITKVGKFIRKYSIDELPQIVNVLKGEMSVIGPRPPIPREVEEYTDHEMKRLEITPGLSCIWQVQPNRNDIPFDEWVEMDLEYIRNVNFLLDWKLILLTFLPIFKGYGR